MQKNSGFLVNIIIIFGILIIISTIILSIISFLFFKHTFEDDAKQELNIITDSAYNMLEALSDVSIKNFLRAIAEKNKEIMKYYYNLYKTGKLTEEQAKNQAIQVFLQQTIGISGYIYCIDSKGIMRIHPEEELIGENLSNHSFVQEQIVKKNGYLEYMWQNPGEKEKRPKALYMVYFKEWDMIISASSYRKEFNYLLKVEDFKDKIKKIKIKNNGYIYIIDRKGNFIIHPVMEGKNAYNDMDINGKYFIREMIEKKNGEIIYTWQNENEEKPYKKIVIFKSLDKLDWIIASNIYLNDLNQNLVPMLFLIIFLTITITAFTIIITIVISNSITKSIKQSTLFLNNESDKK